MCVYIDFSGQNSIESEWIVFTLQVRSVTPPLPGGSIRPPCREVEVVEVASLYGTERDKTTTGYRPVRECSRCKQGWSRAPGEILPTFTQQATTLPFTSLHFPPLMPFARYFIKFCYHCLYHYHYHHRRRQQASFLPVFLHGTTFLGFIRSRGLVGVCV